MMLYLSKHRSSSESLIVRRVYINFDNYIPSEVNQKSVQCLEIYLFKSDYIFSDLFKPFQGFSILLAENGQLTCNSPMTHLELKK